MTPEPDDRGDRTVDGDVYLSDMKRVLAISAVVACGVVFAGCGASTKISRVGGVIEIGSGVKSSSLVKSVDGVQAGTSAAVLRSRLGAPVARYPAPLSCWVYRAHQRGTDVRELDFCMDAKHRVTAISLGAIHG